MDIREKLKRLREIDDVALIQWTGGLRVDGGKFIPATELRMQILACDRGKVYFSVSGSVMSSQNGRSQLRWYDENMCRIASGPRKGINMLREWVHRNEEFTTISRCRHCEVTEQCDRFTEKRVLAMGASMWYPVYGLPVPDMYRLTMHPETLRPIYTKQLLAAIGAAPRDSADELDRKFLANIDRLGSRTAEGWVVRDELVAMGGMCCCASEGITKMSGSRVFVMPLKLLRLDIKAKGWIIHTGEEDEVEGISSEHSRDSKTGPDDVGDDRS